MSYPYQPPGPAGYPQQQPSYAGGYPGQGDIYHLRLIKHTGALIFWFQQNVYVSGTREQCEAGYRDAQFHNLLAGWWSFLSILVLNWIALFGNLSAIRKLRELDAQGGPSSIPGYQPAQFASAAPATPAGWYPDPSGQPAQRYWDGRTWTNWTHPPSHG